MAHLVAMQDGPSVPEGWDIMLNLSQQAVQALVVSNWTRALGANGDRPLLWVAPGEVDGEHDIVVVKSALPRPEVSLNAADQAAHVDFEIDSGTLQVGRARAGLVSGLTDRRALVDSGEVSWSEPVEITPQNPLQLSGSIPVTADAAADGRSFSIGLDWQGADFTLSGSKGHVSSQAVRQALQHWLADQKLDGRIGTLKLADGGATTVLTPASVVARMVASSDGRPMLQILTGPSLGAKAPAADASVPYPDGHDFSLVVSSKATMAMIANGYNLGTGVVKLVSVPPQDGQRHWFAQVHQPMVFDGSFGNQNGEVYVRDHAEFYMRFGGSADEGLTLFTHTDPNSTVRLHLELAAHYPVAISGEGADQVVGLREGAQSVTGDGFYEAIVKPQLEAFLHGDIKTDMSKVRMTALSDLVLRDLTLSGHGLRFEIAALPAELLILGSLTPHV